MQTSKRRALFSVLTLIFITSAGCSPAEKPVSSTPVNDAPSHAGHLQENDSGSEESQLAGIKKQQQPLSFFVASPESNADRQAFFGDLHVHTTYSLDAFAFGTVATPSDAYRYAKGDAIRHPGGFDVQLRDPLDFYAVTDHAGFLGLMKEAANPATPFSKLPYVEYLHNLNAPENVNMGTLATRYKIFTTFIGETLSGIEEGRINVDMISDISKNAWSDTVDAAEQHNIPGQFTTFVAYEYTATSADSGNLHRNVIFRGADKLPMIPFSTFQDNNPESLWDWMDDLRDQGVESLAIPHNSNGSNGQMFKLVDWAGNPMDENYTRKRLRNEPLVEITQVKGTSETHPLLSDNDEWAGFEIMPYRVATRLSSEPVGSYARDALLSGLAFEDRGISNPYKFGFIGASDTHTGAVSDDESNYFAKVGLLDATGVLRGSVSLPEDQVELIKASGRSAIKTVDGKEYSVTASETYGASGLTGVWAEENTREAIYDALRRKETFATSGPRIRIRFFGGYDFSDTMLTSDDGIARAYKDGVSMGSDLLAADSAIPSFLLWAVRDAKSTNLQRLQIVKGWTVSGEHSEQVYDVACSDGMTVDPLTHRCPDNSAEVDLSDCSVTADVGAAELKTVWKDPDFDASNRAFYYLRVLENPSCRWSSWDAIRAGETPRTDIPATIQERAWSSPIWYEPAS